MAWTVALTSTIVLSVVSPLQTWFVYSTVLGMSELRDTHLHQRLPVHFVWHHFHLENDPHFQPVVPSPQRQHSGDVDLQLPRASVKLTPLNRIANSLTYSLTLFLTLPESTPNLEIGTFTVRLDILDAYGTRLDQIHRSVRCYFERTHAHNTQHSIKQK